MVKKTIRCHYCNNTSSTHKIIRIFLNFDTSDNRSKNMIPACENCAKLYKLKFMSNAVLTLKTMGLRPDSRGRWRLDKELIRTELSNEREMLAKIAMLEQEVKDLEFYISHLVKHEFVTYDNEEGI